jgi:hypothetical protein
MMLFVITVAQPAWIAISNFYGIYEYQYVWSVSAIFMNGQSPAIILLLMFILWFSVFFYATESQFLMSSSAIPGVRDNRKLKPKTPLVPWWLIYCVYFLVIIADASVMLGLDVIFVICTLNLSTSVLFAISMIIAVLRILINSVLVWKFVPVFSKIVERLYLKLTQQTSLITMPRKDEGQEQESKQSELNKINTEDEHDLRKNDLFQFINEDYLIGKILIVNNILYPVLAVMIVLPDCFYYALVQPPTVTSSFSYLSCSVYTFSQCIPSSIHVVKDTTSFIPPFDYTYLCAANVITYYISLFFFSFFFSAILIPLLKLVLKYVYNRIISEREGTDDTTNPITTGAAMKQVTTLEKLVVIFVPNRFRHYHPQKETPQMVDLSFCGRIYQFKLKSLPISNWKKFICQVNGDLTILFSFGILFPPLMVFGGICLIGVISYEFLTLGKLLYETRQLNYLWYEKQLLDESQRLMKVFRSNIYWTMVISCLLLGFIVFDTWGIQRGWQYGIIGFFTLNIIPLCSFCLYYWYRKKLRHRRKLRSATTDGIDVSILREIGNWRNQEKSITSVDNPICNAI